MKDCEQSPWKEDEFGHKLLRIEGDREIWLAPYGWRERALAKVAQLVQACAVHLTRLSDWILEPLSVDIHVHVEMEFGNGPPQ